jgi:hypothetical protein
MVRNVSTRMRMRSSTIRSSLSAMVSVFEFVCEQQGFSRHKRLEENHLIEFVAIPVPVLRSGGNAVELVEVGQAVGVGE